MKSHHVSRTLAIVLVLFVGRWASAQGIIIDHRSVTEVPKLPQATLQRVAGEFNFFFAHASVGGNMLKGLNALAKAQPERYPLRPVKEDATPPDDVVKGRVYEFNRGNPGWKRKVDEFKTAIDNGWAGKADIVLNKFCYVDPDVRLDYYAVSNAGHSAMSELEKQHPKTRFVYMTIPLETNSDATNVTRNVFNDALRAWVKKNNKILFDIADIQAHDPDGKPCTFVARGKTYFRMFDDYSTDGGHLNALGAKQVALGFYALGAVLLESR